MWHNSLLSSLLITIIVINLGGCSPIVMDPDLTQIDVTSHALSRNSLCSDAFVTHDLDHITTVASDPVQMFDSNGAGLAINDLDQDGDLDLVFANLRGKNAILWNEGELNFTRNELDHGQSRAAATIDVDGDGLLDVVFTQRTGSIAYWHNDGQQQFAQQPLTGVQELAYAMNWGDLDGDGDLDLVTASYDAGLEKDLGNAFMLGKGAGVFYFENDNFHIDNGEFIPTRLGEKSHALAIFFGDLNGDSQPDILVGNDFSLVDQVWLVYENGWQLASPFETTTHSTMSYAVGDIDNDGQQELFATDMKPYADDEATRNAWMPVMEMMPHHEVEGDPQIMENVLQGRGVGGMYHNVARSLGLDATGWSWSAKFGDLDQDGLLDIYVVNGMIANELFGHLPNSELVERNQALHNQKRDGFIPAPGWALDSEESGRGMSMADLDGDGDLDIVINNLLSPAQLFENQLCTGASLQVDLRWPESANTYGVGAELILDTSAGHLTRRVEAMSGYLSGDPTRIHFGFPTDATLNHLDIRWPDGTMTRVPDISANTRLQIQR